MIQENTEKPQNNSLQIETPYAITRGQTYERTYGYFAVILYRALSPTELVLDGDVQEEFGFRQYPGQENVGDYPSNTHTGASHQHVQLYYYIHMENPSTELFRASMPSAQQGCAETPAGPYYQRVSLPRIPGYCQLDKQARQAQSAYTVPSADWSKTLHHYA